MARLHKPLPILMLLWPCFFGLAIGKANVTDYLIFLLGTIAMRSAGCIINDIVDKDFDSHVERTKKRPLAAKIITINDALLGVFFFLSIGLIVWLFLNQMAKYVSLFGVLLMVMYPFMKRITYWPQLFLGCAFNYGFIVAVVHTGVFSWDLLILFFSLVLWTVFYDTIYAFSDLNDDLKIGIKSTAIVMRNFPKIWLAAFNILIHLMLFLYLSGSAANIIFIIAGFLYLQFLLAKWDINDTKSCLRIFAMGHFWGLALWLRVEIIRIFAP